MADTKVSGLALVAAWASTLEFPVNDSGVSHKITGAQIAAAFPQGTASGSWYAPVVANQTGITTVVDGTGLTVTITAGTGRRLLITAQVQMLSTVSGDIIQVQILEDATVIQIAQLVASTTGQNMTPMAVRTPTAGAHTYKVQFLRAGGTGSLSSIAGATDPAFILVQDIGV